MPYCNWHEVDLRGQIYLSDTDHIKLFIVVFANGAMMAFYCVFSRELNQNADFENLSIDSTSTKAHPQSAGAKKGL